MRIAYHILFLSFFDYKTDDHKEIDYRPSVWAKELGMGKATIINCVKKMVDYGYILRNGSKIKPLEMGIEIEPWYRNRTEAVLKQNPVVLKQNPVGIEVEPQTPVYDRLREGFPTPLVFFKYFYSITTVGQDDLLLILENIQELEIFTMARKENYPNHTETKAFVNNKKFRQACDWIREIYESDDKSGDISVDRYLLYVLLDSFLHAKNPQGKFITAVEMLKKDGSRMDIDMSESLSIEEKSQTHEELKRQEQATLRMIGDLDKPSTVKDPLEGPIDFLEVLKNKMNSEVK